MPNEWAGKMMMKLMVGRSSEWTWRRCRSEKNLILQLWPLWWLVGQPPGPCSNLSSSIHPSLAGPTNSRTGYDKFSQSRERQSSSTDISKSTRGLGTFSTKKLKWMFKSPFLLEDLHGAMEIVGINESGGRLLLMILLLRVY